MTLTHDLLFFNKLILFLVTLLLLYIIGVVSWSPWTNVVHLSGEGAIFSLPEKGKVLDHF